MSKVWNYLVLHRTSASLIAAYVYSAFIGALPMPDDKSGKFYHWFFVFTNTIAANLSRVNAHFSQDKALAQGDGSGAKSK
jgi:hypothetical protein